METWGNPRRPRSPRTPLNQPTIPTTLQYVPFLPPIIEQQISTKTKMASEIGLNFTQVEFAQHPYYPLGVAVVGYAANQWSLLLLLGAFAVAWSTVLGAAYFVVAKKQPTMPVSEVLTFMWFVLCKSLQNQFVIPTDENTAGSIHLFFEGNTNSLYSKCSHLMHVYQDFMSTISGTWPAPSTCSANFGRSTPSRTRAT